MADKEMEMVSDWGVCLSRHLQILAASFPKSFPPDHIVEFEVGPLLWWIAQVVEGNGGIPQDNC